MAFKYSDLKSLIKFPLLQEKQRSVKVSDMQHEMVELCEELWMDGEEGPTEELAELKKLNGDSEEGIGLKELNSLKTNESVNNLMVSGTMQFEETRISLEETKPEIKNFKDGIRFMRQSASLSMSSNKKMAAVRSYDTREETRSLKKELRLALEAEDNSRKAMNDFAVALDEVYTNGNQTKRELSVKHSELGKAIEEAKTAKSLLQTTEQKLWRASNEFDKVKMEFEESVSSSKAKEGSFLSCAKLSKEEIASWKQENSRLNEAWMIAREDNIKLRQRMKQAVNDAIALKEALEIVRNENSQMKDQLVEKENSLQKIRQDYESLRVSEAASLDSVRELGNLLSSASAADSKKTSNLSDVGTLKLSQSAIVDANVRRSFTKFLSERWKPSNIRSWTNHRPSVGGGEIVSSSSLDREKAIESSNLMFHSLRNVSFDRLPSSLFNSERGTFDHTERIKHNAMDDTGSMSSNTLKKKTIFERFGDALRRKKRIRKLLSTFR